MKVKVNDATLIQLNWMVAKAEGIGLGPRGFIVYYHEGEPAPWQPTTDWAQAGPIIGREGIGLLKVENRLPHQQWDAGETDEFPNTLWAVVSGPTPLIAAMRCYVASKLGDEVDVPEELV